MSNIDTAELRTTDFITDVTVRALNALYADGKIGNVDHQYFCGRVTEDRKLIREQTATLAERDKEIERLRAEIRKVEKAWFETNNSDELVDALESIFGEA